MNRLLHANDFVNRIKYNDIHNILHSKWHMPIIPNYNKNNNYVKHIPNNTRYSNDQYEV